MEGDKTYIAKVLYAKHGGTILKEVFFSLESAQKYIQQYFHRHKKLNCTLHVVETSYNTITKSWQFINQKWVCIR